MIKPIMIALALLIQILGSPLANAADISAQQLLQRLDSNSAPLILDVRQPEEYAAGHVPKAINIPHTELQKRLDELSGKQHDEIVVYCASGRRAAIAQEILVKSGFTKIIHLQGDMNGWRDQGLRIELPGENPTE